ncbi:MAG: helix-turn-helix transcriptional regulator [Desulfobacteraceae bacterium]|nr:helix-turn-helix transcriptional regulator [Desulfobacteraceae bacterium]
MALATLETLREREREVRRELILSAARKLFADKDFRSVTVREIAKKAGVSPGTIYRYYENLDELFLDVFFAGAREITERLDEEYEKKRSCSLLRFCEIYIGYLNENMTFYQMMGHFMLGGNLSPNATKRLNPIMRELMNRVEGIVKEAGLKGETRLVSHALFSSLNGIMISYAQYPGRSLDEIRRHTLRLSRIVAASFHKK